MAPIMDDEEDEQGQTAPPPVKMPWRPQGGPQNGPSDLQAQGQPQVPPEVLAEAARRGPPPPMNMQGVPVPQALSGPRQGALPMPVRRPMGPAMGQGAPVDGAPPTAGPREQPNWQALAQRFGGGQPPVAPQGLPGGGPQGAPIQQTGLPSGTPQGGPQQNPLMQKIAQQIAARRQQFGNQRGW